MILQCKITKVVERPGVHYRGRHSPWISSDRDGSFLIGSTPARIFCLLSFSSHEPRSVNSRFDWSKRRKQGLCASTHTQDAPLSLVGAISSTFPYHWSITFTFCIALYRVLKMHYLLPICKERFSIHTALVFYFTLLLLFFRFHMLRSSLLYFRIPRTTLLLFVFNERWILDVRFGDDIPLFEGRQMLGFRITRRRNGLAR